MAALAAPMRQIIKEETTLILHTAAESVSASSTSSAAGVGMAVREAVVKEAGVGLGAVREMAVKESPLVVGRVGGAAVEGVGARVGGVVAEEGMAGGKLWFFLCRDGRYDRGTDIAQSSSLSCDVTI